MELKQPGISIIVPVYNVEKYIHQCIDSILNQSFKDYELILVDDGSPDNCPGIIDNYAEKDKRIRGIHQTNGGVSRARNTGIKSAKGKWLYFVDSDDWLIEDSLKELFEFAEKTEADVVFTDCIEQYESGKSRRIHIYSETFESDDKNFISQIQKSVLCHKFSPYFNAGADNAYPAPWSKLIKAQLVIDSSIEFNPAVKGVYDDGLFTVEVLEKANKVAYNKNCTYNYRILSSSIVHSYKKDMVDRFELNCFEMDKFIEKYRKDEDFKQAEYCRRVAYLSSFMASYYFNPTSRMRYSKRIEGIKSACARKPWAKAIISIDSEKLENKHKYTVYCLRKGLYIGLKIYSVLQQAKRKINQ